jgi:hypothetical protein
MCQLCRIARSVRFEDDVISWIVLFHRRGQFKLSSVVFNGRGQ